LLLLTDSSALDTRKKKGVEVLRVKLDCLPEGWQTRACPIWLVLRAPDDRTRSSIRWMDLGADLTQQSGRRKTPVTQVEFRGEPLTARTLMALRDRMVPPPRG